MSQWNHLLCESCYEFFQPGRKAVRVPMESRDGPQPCCSCGRETNSGIYFRRDPLGGMKCRGEGVVHGVEKRKSQ